MKQFIDIILASGSPRRKELFEQAGIQFSVVKSNAEEKVTSTVPGNAVKELALQKAKAVKKEFLENLFRQRNFVGRSFNSRSRYGCRFRGKNPGKAPG